MRPLSRWASRASTSIALWIKKGGASPCFKSFQTAERTLEGIEAMNMMSKGQVKRLSGSVAMGQEMFVASLFQKAA
jgi:transposase-like protein